MGELDNSDNNSSLFLERERSFYSYIPPKQKSNNQKKATMSLQKIKSNKDLYCVVY